MRAAPEALAQLGGDHSRDLQGLRALYLPDGGETLFIHTWTGSGVCQLCIGLAPTPDRCTLAYRHGGDRLGWGPLVVQMGMERGWNQMFLGEGNGQDRWLGQGGASRIHPPPTASCWYCNVVFTDPLPSTLDNDPALQPPTQAPLWPPPRRPPSVTEGLSKLR